MALKPRRLTFWTSATFGLRSRVLFQSKVLMPRVKEPCSSTAQYSSCKRNLSSSPGL